MVSNGKQRRPVNGKRRAAAGNGDRPTILIVDDEPAIRVLLDAALDGEGYRLLEAADGPSALETARTEHPDLVLLDIGLPGLSGLEVCRRLRDEAGTAGTPVLFLTGLGREAEEEAAATVGAQGVITKPFSPAALVKQVAHMLRQPAAAASFR